MLFLISIGKTMIMMLFMLFRLGCAFLKYVFKALQYVGALAFVVFVGMIFISYIFLEHGFENQLSLLLLFFMTPVAAVILEQIIDAVAVDLGERILNQMDRLDEVGTTIHRKKYEEKIAREQLDR